MPEVGTVDLDPEHVEDLYQEPPQLVAVPVKGEGAFLTHALPAKRVQAATDAVPVAAWTPLLPETPKRHRTVLLSTDKPFYYSPTGTGSTGMLWPANQPLYLFNVAKVYVMSADATLPATISHLSELWAD
jgi:hypothetical protein